MADHLAALDRKLRKADRDRKRMKRIYWEVRFAVVEYLGGKCSNPECGETDITKLEVHHDTPTLAGGYKNSTGWDILKEWKKILAGETPAKLFCHDCHVKHGHHGNTSELKKVKNGQGPAEAKSSP